MQRGGWCRGVGDAEWWVMQRGGWCRVVGGAERWVMQSGGWCRGVGDAHHQRSLPTTSTRCPSLHSLHCPVYHERWVEVFAMSTAVMSVARSGVLSLQVHSGGGGGSGDRGWHGDGRGCRQ